MGVGYRARQFIPRGTLLLRESPAILIPQGNIQEDRDGMIGDAVANMRPQELNNFGKLQVTQPFVNSGPIVGRFLTNALKCEVENGAHFAGLFFMACRFNSSCIPNVHQHWDGTSMTMQFRAMTDIQPNQELYICYSIRNLTHRRAERRARIQQTCGYECQCVVCLQPNADSDARRERVGRALGIQNRDAYAAVIPNVSTHNARGRIKGLSKIQFNMVIGALRDLDRERMHHYRDTLLYDGYSICVAAGDGNNAMLWLRRAYEAVVAVVGPQDPRAQMVVAELNAMPRQQFYWDGWVELGPPPVLN